MNLRRETIKFSAAIGITVLGGLSFHILLARRFGISWQLDCFFIALTLYNWLSVFNSFITSLYIPIFSEVRNKSETDALIFADVVLKWTLLLASLILVVVLIFHKPILGLLAPGFDEKMTFLSARMIRIVIFAMLFYSISNTVVLTLNALYYYTVPALLDILDPVLNIAVLFLLVPLYGIVGMAYGCLLSNGLKSCLLLGYLYRKTGWRPTARFSHPKLVELFERSNKMALSGFIWSLREVITRNVASRMGEGAVSLYSYAEKVILTLVQIMINPLVKVYYSRVCEWTASRRWEDIRFLFVRTARASFFLNVFVCSGLSVFFASLLRVFFLGSKFSAESILSLEALLDIMLLFLLIISLENYFSRLIFASKRVGVAILNASAGIAVMLISSFYLTRFLGIYGLAWSVVAAQFCVSVCYFLFTRKWLAVDFTGLSRNLLRIMGVGVMFALAGIFLKKVVTADWMMILLVLPVWTGSYWLIARIFQKEELRILLEQRK